MQSVVALAVDVFAEIDFEAEALRTRRIDGGEAGVSFGIEGDVLEDLAVDGDGDVVFGFVQGVAAEVFQVRGVHLDVDGMDVGGVE